MLSRPAAGGSYVYLRESYGRAVAFLYGWKCLLVMDPGLSAALAAGFARYATLLLPQHAVAAKPVAVAAIGVLAAVNLSGLGRAASVLRALTALKLGLLALLIVWGFASGRGSFGHFLPLAAAPPPLSVLAGGVVAAFFCFGGFWDVAKLAGEVRDPSRTLPRALAFGVTLATGVYLLTSAVFVYLVRPSAPGEASAVAAQAGLVLFGPAGGQAFALVVCVCVLGSLLAVLMAAPRVYYAMGRDGLLPRKLAKLDPRFGTPARAILLQAGLAAVLVVAGSFEEIVAYFVFATLLFVGLSVGAVFLLPRPAAGAFRMPAFPAPALVFLGLLAMLELLLAFGQPRPAALGLLVVGLGLPVYRLALAGGGHSLEDEP